MTLYFVTKGSLAGPRKSLGYPDANAFAAAVATEVPGALQDAELRIYFVDEETADREWPDLPFNLYDEFNKSIEAMKKMLAEVDLKAVGADIEYLMDLRSKDADQIKRLQERITRSTEARARDKQRHATRTQELMERIDRAESQRDAERARLREISTIASGATHPNYSAGLHASGGGGGGGSTRIPPSVAEQVRKIAMDAYLSEVPNNPGAANKEKWEIWVSQRAFHAIASNLGMGGAGDFSPAPMNGSDIGRLYGFRFGIRTEIRVRSFFENADESMSPNTHIPVSEVLVRYNSGNPARESKEWKSHVRF